MLDTVGASNADRSRHTASAEVAPAKLKASTNGNQERGQSADEGYRSWNGMAASISPARFSGSMIKSIRRVSTWNRWQSGKEDE